MTENIKKPSLIDCALAREVGADLGETLEKLNMIEHQEFFSEGRLYAWIDDATIEDKKKVLVAMGYEV